MAFICSSVKLTEHTNTSYALLQKRCVECIELGVIYIYNLYNDMSTSTVTSNDRYICMCFHTFLLCLCLNVFADVIVGYVD